jgi:vancomycin permeability regulator SanA
VGIASNQGGAAPEVNCSYTAVAKTLATASKNQHYRWHMIFQNAHVVPRLRFAVVIGSASYKAGSGRAVYVRESRTSGRSSCHAVGTLFQH